MPNVIHLQRYPVLDGSLVKQVVAASSRPQSRAHGEQHWKAVAWAGLELARAGHVCDHELVLLFALFHDSRRFNEFRDPEHGLRGADLAQQLADAFRMEDGRLATLVDACTRHDQGDTTTDPTIGACWDADRLNLWRVGIRPDPRLLSTSSAPGLIEDAIEFHGGTYEWPSLFAEYAAL